jgi:hypothetical protein
MYRTVHDFDGDKSISRVGPENFNFFGWALKIKTFLGPEMATSEASAI